MAAPRRKAQRPRSILMSAPPSALYANAPYGPNFECGVRCEWLKKHM